MWCLPLVGILFSATAIGPHLVFDDYVLGLEARGDSAALGLSHGAWDLFTFTNGRSNSNQLLMQQGVLLPWWTDPQLQIAFFRPLSSLFHRLDFALWPEAPRLMYCHSLIWLGLMLTLVTSLYRRLESSPGIAGLAALVFALDDSHGATVAWLSNRGALIATFFGVLTLLLHHAWREHGARASAWGAALAWLLALAAGELGLGALGYLLAYALFLERAPLGKRLASLAPYLLVLAAWSVVYLMHGAGVRGSGLYLSPWNDVHLFAELGPRRLLGLLAAELGPVPADLLLMGEPRHFAYWATITTFVLAAATVALWQPLRRDRTARFWLCGMLLALLPLASSFPSDRLLPLVSVGGAGLLSRVVAPLFAPSGRQRQATGRSGLALLFCAIHLVLAPVCLPLRAAQMQLVGRSLARASASLDDIAGLERRTVVILNAPVDAFASYLQAERAWKRLPRPQQLYWLTSAGSSLRVTRRDPKTLVVERALGFLSTPLERHYRARAGSFKAGQQIQVGLVVASVLRVGADGRPLAVSFHFPEAIESDSYLLLVWQDDRYRPLAPGRLSQPLELPAQDLGQILARSARGRA